MASNVIEWSADDLVPAQWFGGVYAGRPQLEDYQGLRRLAQAVLLDALRNATGRELKSAGSRARRRADTLAWFHADDPEAPFSFANICELLGINPAGIRAALAEGRKTCGRCHDE